jgi:hypothetical protein
MAKISESTIKKAIIAIEAGRAKHPEAPPLKLAEDPKLRMIRKDRDKLFVEFLQSAGLDMRKVAALGEQHDTQLGRLVDKYRTDAGRRSRKKGTHYLSVMGQCKTLVAASDDTNSVSIVKPFLIWATPRSNILSDSQYADSDSWAKFKVSSSGDETHKVSFYFLWSNPFGNGVVIDPLTFLIATGYIEAHADRMYLFANVSNATATAQFYLWQWWDQSQAPILSASEQIWHVDAVGEYFQTGTTGKYLAAGLRLGAGQFFVPRYSTAVFEVAVSVDFYSDTGTAYADFESFNYNVTCPVVAFPVLQTPF